jgi:hypothetical protein
MRHPAVLRHFAILHYYIDFDSSRLFNIFSSASVALAFAALGLKAPAPSCFLEFLTFQ